MSVQTHVELTGPFFEHQPGLTLRGNIRKMMAAVAQEGQRAVQSLYPVGPTGAGRAGVVGRVASLSGKPWMASAVISQSHVYPWPGGGQAQYRGGKSEARHHMFRTVYRDLRSSKAVLAANLTQGIE